MYRVMYRTPGGTNVMMKAGYTSLDDGESGVIDSFPWITEEGWQRGDDSSTFNLSDGSCIVIFKE